MVRPSNLRPRLAPAAPRRSLFCSLAWHTKTKLHIRNVSHTEYETQGLHCGNVALPGSYRPRSLLTSQKAIYSSGLRAGFANTEQLPNVFQVNVSAQRSFRIPGVGQLIERISILNLFDRINLIRPAAGIGIFQSAYSPRFYGSQHRYADLLARPRLRPCALC
jgi:hypothetical protein